MENLRILAHPTLQEPVAILGFGGWANAGDVSTSTLSYLIQALDAQPLAELDPDPYYDFTAQRPTGRIEDGRVIEVRLPSNSLHYFKSPSGPDGIIFKGEEPHFYWKQYVGLLVDQLISYGVRLAITVGGTYDERLHTDPPLVSFITDDMVVGETLAGYGVARSQYEGPVSVHTPLYLRCRERGLTVVGLWGHAPVYVQTGNFPLVMRIVKLIGCLGGPKPDLTSLEAACQEMEQQIEALVARSPKLAGYIDRLKQSPKVEPPVQAALPRSKCKVIPLDRTKKGELPPS